MKHQQKRRPDRISTYFLTEKKVLAIITVSGLIYNIGLVAGPWFEGKLAQCLLDNFNHKSTFRDMLRLALLYAAVIAFVQIARYIKRFYVRRFANHLNRNMKQVIYGNLIYKEKAELERENTGTIMTKAIADVEACVEGMRKFTTEVFDTGVVMIGYFIFLLSYDWRLTLLCMLFPPISYYLADRMKTIVQRSNAVYKESSGQLSTATLDRVQGALTYRVFGCEEQRNADYETHLNDYEKKAVRANIWVSSLQPLYKVISMIGVLPILYFGARNVLGDGWAVWDIAAFTAFLSCFAKLSLKTSRAAKLFNAVQKAQVSWKRIRPLMKQVPDQKTLPAEHIKKISAEHLGFAYPDSAPVFHDLTFRAGRGTITGITGPVACGKSTLGKTFLCESPYLGSLKIDGSELSSMDREMQKNLVGYLGHAPEIMSASIRENISLGREIDVSFYLRAVCLEEEVAAMPDGVETQVGSGGIRLSGGQQQRLALARTLAHDRPILVLDDPFSALDRRTESQIFKNLKQFSPDRIIFLISHRLYLFPELDQIIWMNNRSCTVSTHTQLLLTDPIYANLYRTQAKEESGYET